VGDVVAGLGALSAAAPAGGEGRCVQVYSGVDGQPLWPAPVCDPSSVSTQSLSLGPDVNGDGRGDVAVGTAGAAQGPSTVTILSGADGRVLQRVAAPGDGLAAGFGRPLALAGDLDGDHAPDLAVGSAGAAAGFTVFTASSGRPLGSRRLAEGEPRLLGVPPLVATEVWSLVVGDPAAGIDVYVAPRSEEPP